MNRPCRRHPPSNCYNHCAVLIQTARCPSNGSLQRNITMALTLEANYSKKIGLPGYSSHQYSLTLKTELSDLSQAEAESTRLHQTLQTSVDRELQKVGFLPANGNGHHPKPANGNGHSNG